MSVDRAAAFEQWSQGGGSPRAEWTITRAEAAFVFAGLRVRERAAVLEGERRIAALEACLVGARSEAEAHIAELEARLAKVPALVAAARPLVDHLDRSGDACVEPGDLVALADALAAQEQD